MSTPIERLRERHQLWDMPEKPNVHVCAECADPWPCDTIAALDALEEQVDHPFERRELDKAYAAEMAASEQSRKLQARIDAARELIRQALRLRHTIVSIGSGKRACGSSLGTSIDTCENCRPYREWLGGKDDRGE